jgi:hypothetical protein
MILYNSNFEPFALICSSRLSRNIYLTFLAVVQVCVNSFCIFKKQMIELSALILCIYKINLLVMTKRVIGSSRQYLISNLFLRTDYNYMLYTCNL